MTMPLAPAQLTHAQIWAAIDALASLAGTSPSGLAKRAGLDPTTFNKSKRITADQRQRWPSTESVAKCLAATGVSLDQFVGLIAPGPRGTSRTLPLMGFAEAGEDRHFDERGFPEGSGWEELGFPAVEDRNAYALEIAGDVLRPVYRDGTFLVVSPSAAIRRGDRVVVKLRGGEVMVRELARKTAKAIELRALGAGQPDRTLATEDYLWIARIVWASQ
ncbi:MAG TPA: helix-turn-helix transcriptional regulator [Xanthobacteraceae bacterium]|jgi:phage repressor protein C with HTH and peptisase S24 domain|nr:helix-turn-helix transcriptional regulator [Xanthobacteraceae bacterium]